MKKRLVTRLLACLTIGITAYTSSFAKVEQVQIQHFSMVKKQAEQLLKTDKPSQILLVFDDDNTLLTLNQYLGSVPWWSWQSKLSKTNPDSKQLVSKNFAGLMRAQVTLFTLSHMHATESDIPALIKSMQQQGIQTMVLSARGTNMRNLTQRELKNNHLNFAKNAPAPQHGFAGSYCPGQTLNHVTCQKSVRKISYLNGVMLIAGQNKGQMLMDFLSKNTQDIGHIKAIIFVDDQAKNTKAVAKSFAHSHLLVITDRYGFDDQWVNAFNKQAKAKVSRQWDDLQKLTKTIFK